MRFPFFSLRTGILAYLAFLIVCAMLLINVVMVVFEEKDLVQAKLETGQLLLHALERQVVYEMAYKGKRWEGISREGSLQKEIRRLIRMGGFTDALIVDSGGVEVYSLGSWTSGLRPVSPTGWEPPRMDEAKKEALSLSRRALRIRKWAFEFYGSTWGVIWLAHERMNMSSPFFFEGRLMGAITISAPLAPMYEMLRKSEKKVLIYILFNTIILVLFGFYLLSRTVVKPIHRLLHITDRFREGEPFPSFGDSPRNEIGHLFSSLNRMLNRLEENKKELRAHVSSLERANQEIKKVQEEIIRSEKAASLGRLATGVAHEIGNPIGIILGYLELLKGEGLEEEERKDFLDRVESELARIHRIIKQLLDFSRPSSGEKKKGNIHEMIMETVNMLKPHPMMADIEVKTLLNAARDKVWAPPDQLRQVFLNIIMNSADAMQDDRPTDGNSLEKLLRIDTQNRDDSIEIRFADTGKGIPQKELVHIFDPFYTTKEPGKGTGLGLSVCYRIIEELGGSIRAESSPGGGATVIVVIPLCQEG